jgi:hypothetical protein
MTFLVYKLLQSIFTGLYMPQQPTQFTKPYGIMISLSGGIQQEMLQAIFVFSAKVYLQ